MKDFYLCADIGGTFIKAGIVTADNEIQYSEKRETKLFLSDDFSVSLFNYLSSIAEKNNLDISLAKGIAIGTTGQVDIKNAVIKKSSVLSLYDYPISKNIEELSGHKVMVANDADVASLAEQKLGAGKNCDNFIMLTLGTGIGGGIVVGGNNLGINFSCPVEVGHMKINCGCKNYKNYEQIGSTTALINMTKKAIEKSPKYKNQEISNVDGRTIFELLDDLVMQRVLKKYIQNVGDGIINLIKIFGSDKVIIGGGISNEREKLIIPLEKYVNKSINQFFGKKVEIIQAQFKNNAGILGAKLLFEV